jgi:hypothetical protein
MARTDTVGRATMPHQKRVRHHAANVLKERPAITGTAIAFLIITNGTVMTVCGLAIGLAATIFLCSIAGLLYRAIAKPGDPYFERTVYLLKLICLYVPRGLFAERSSRVTNAVLSAAGDDPPPTRTPHCPECLLHGEGLQH